MIVLAETRMDFFDFDESSAMDYYRQHHRRSLRSAVIEAATFGVDGAGTLVNVTSTSDDDVIDLDDAAHSTFEIVIISLVVAVLAFVTAGGNLMVMISFKMDRQLQTVGI